ncbi:MAG: hypothetical protein QM778_33165 [Myxococcales bacterium]
MISVEALDHEHGPGGRQDLAGVLAQDPGVRAAVELVALNHALNLAPDQALACLQRLGHVSDLFVVTRAQQGEHDQGSEEGGLTGASRSAQGQVGVSGLERCQHLALLPGQAGAKVALDLGPVELRALLLESEPSSASELGSDLFFRESLRRVH